MVFSSTSDDAKKIILKIFRFAGLGKSINVNVVFTRSQPPGGYDAKDGFASLVEKRRHSGAVMDPFLVIVCNHCFITRIIALLNVEIEIDGASVLSDENPAFFLATSTSRAGGGQEESGCGQVRT